MITDTFFVNKCFGENYQEVIGNNIEEFMEAINYADFNVGIGNAIGVTAGLIKTGNAEYPYISFGLMGQPLSGSISLTFSPNQVSLGWNVAIQGNSLGGAFQAGFHSYSWKTWWEVRVGIPSISITAIYVFPPLGE